MSKTLGIRLTWHLSYAALLSVPVLIFMLVSWGTSRALEDQLEESSTTLVDLMGKDIDGKLEYVSRLINDMTWDPLAQSLMNLSHLDTGSQRFDMVRLADHLTLSAGYSRFSDFVFIAFPNLGAVLIPTSQYSEDQFYRSYFLESGLSRDSFHALLVQRHDGDSRAVVYQNALGRNQDAVLILKSLPPSPSIPAAACIGVLISTETIVASLHAAVKDSRSEIQILNDRGEIVVSTLKTPWDPSGPNESGVRIQGVDYTVLQQQTQKFAWTVQLLVPDSVIKGNLLFAQLVILVGLASCLILGIWLTIYLVRRNYGPVSRVLDALSAIVPRGGGDPEGDEFSQIQRSVSLVKDRLEQSKEPLRQNLAAGLLRGRADTVISLEDRLSALGVVFLTQEFVVCLVQVDEGGPATADLQRELEAGFEPWGTCLQASEETPLVFLLNLNSASSAETIPRLQEAVAAWAPAEGAAFAFSSVVQGLGAIPTAWTQAKTALEYRFVVGGAYPFAWDQLKAGQPAHFYQYDGEKEGRLVTLIKAGETDAASALLDEIFTENAQPGGVRLSPVAAQCLVWDLAATMMKSLAEISGDESFTSLFQPVAALAQGSPWDKARSGLQSLVREACAYARTQNGLRQAQLKTGSSLQFVRQVCEYLQARFSDPTLDLTKIADAHNLTPAYLSRLFRENAEEGIFDYLHRLRIEHAKVLLRSGTGNLHDIGLACGFVDVKTFIRNFRRFTGVTPGKFRETA